ncbi:MAG: choice-of-anchor L domain-containing protein [Saprospiraceae bacterium]
MRPFYAFFSFLLFTSMLTAQQLVPTVLLDAQKQREKLFPSATNQSITYANLIPGERYLLTIVENPAFPNCRPTITPHEKELLTPATRKAGHTIEFIARGERHQFDVKGLCVVEAGSALEAQGVAISIACLSCTQAENKQNRTGAALLETAGGFTAEELVKDVLIGSNCFDVKNVVYSGDPRAIGRFSKGATNIGFNTGVIIATGEIDIAQGPNDLDNASDGFGVLEFDADLSVLSGGNDVYDVAEIQFDFTPTQTPVTFEFALASEEYCEFVGSTFNDAFGFFISGPGINGPFGGAKNIALVPNTQTNITINTINHLTNNLYYTNNIGPGGILCGQSPSFAPAVNEIQYDGFTKNLVAVADVIPCETYRIKLKIGDIGDGLYDSAVFLKAGSFNAGANATISFIVDGQASDSVYEKCQDAAMLIQRAGGDLNLPLTVSLTVSGSALPNLDFVPFQQVITIPSGVPSLQIPIDVLDDGILEGTETIEVSASNLCVCSKPVQTLFILNGAPPLATISDTIVLNVGETVFIGGVAVNTPGVYLDTLPGLNGCDTLARYVVLQKQPSDIINIYTPVIGFSCDSSVVEVDSSAGFSPNDKVLIIQMQGATVDLTNTANFGTITNAGSAGNNEFNRIEAINGDQITLKYKLQRPYDVAGKIQLIRVPEFTDVTVADLTCKPWDGTTGGVLVFDVSGTLTMNGDIDVSEKGFRGGQYIDANVGIYGETQYFYPPDPKLAGKKGEGIAIVPLDRSFGRGRVANGGGGGNAHNAGGGGGGNFNDGGRGAFEYFNIPGAPNPLTYGIEGVGLGSLSFPGFNNYKYFLGGGGGAGQGNDNKGSSGGHGGGIVMINAGSITGNNKTIASNGQNITGPGGNDVNDGQGAGGAGGTIIVDCDNFGGNLNLRSKGGRGGDCLFFVNSQIIGPGGGGSGGIIVTKPLPANVSVALNGGKHGIANQGLANGAEDGKAGISFSLNNNLFLTDTALSFLADSLLLNITMPTCANPNGGQISVINPTGVTYSLNGGPLQTNNVFANLNAGTYTITVTNGPLCVKDTTVELVELDTTILTLDTFPLCPNDTLYLGNLTVDQPGIYTDTLPGNPGCDTIATYVVIRTDPPTKDELYGLCPGDSIRINNQWYTQGDTTFSYTTPALTGCDTLVNVLLNYLPLPETTKTIAFCPGDTVFVGGNAYTQPDTLFDIILPATVGCDTLATFVLQHLPLPNKTIQVKFCPGDSVLVNGLWFTEADTTVTYTAPATIGCDTIVNAVLTYLPLPEKTIEIEFCQGDTVFVGGQAYTRPDTIFDILLPAAVGCDTLATYVLKYLTPTQPTTLALQCPTNISVSITAGATGAAVSFPDPAADTNCPCPGIALYQTEGLPSGSTFPPGVSEVCFAARDSCGNESTCCFSVTIDEGKACDVKTIGCVRYELLSITRDIKGDKTYRIRITNYCADELVHAAIQLPDGVVARRPTNGSYYTAPSGNPYLVRNPNASPQHSIRFKTAGAAGIKNGESDVFQYTLPEQSQPAYIHVVTRIAPSQYFGAHLNTFFCPITYLPNPWDKPADKPAPRATTTEDDNTEVRVYPNPGDGLFYVDIVDWPSETVQARVFNAQGQLVHETRLAGNAESQTLELSTTLPEGLYILHLQDPTGRSETISLVKF